MAFLEPSVSPSPLEQSGFQALYYPELLHTVNPRGDIGLLTLWSPLRSAQRKLDAISPEILDPAASRVAVVANLYGDGMYAMFCNLLFNPQVRHLVAIGEDLGLAMCDDIRAFLEDGLEDAELLGNPVRRIRGTQRILPAVDEFDERLLRARLTFRYLGRLSDPELPAALTATLRDLPRAEKAGQPERVRVEIPAAGGDDDSYLPSDVNAHQVVRARPIDCWEELVVRTMRFGRPVTLSNGPRLELLNAKAVITAPAAESRDVLARYGFDLDRFEGYQRRILDPDLPEGISYTYGNRLRGRSDTLATAIEKLRADPETRRAYISIWDTAEDLAGTTPSPPCLTTIFFRQSAGRLSLTATYRAHNLMTAWLENVYGLMAIQAHVADGAGLEPGSVTVVSHSLGIDPRSPRYELARAVADGWTRDDDRDREAGKYALRQDPNGYFVVSADHDRGLVVAEHRFEGVLVKRYEARRALTIEADVTADMAVSLISHALWLGRELAAKEQELTRGREDEG